MNHPHNKSRVAVDSSDIKEPERRAKAELAEQTIQRITGFSAKELLEKYHELLAEYQGKQQAPFPFELF